MEQVDKLREQKRPNETMEWRVSNMEKHNQIRRIESQDGKTFFDAENSKFQLDGASGRIVQEDGKITVYDSNGYTAILIEAE